MRRLSVAIVGVLVVAVAAAIVFAHDAVASTVLRVIAARMGYQVQTERLRLSGSSLALVAPVIRNANGEPVFSADRVDIEYSLRDLLPGSQRRFGLRAVDLERPLLTLIHEPDGGYNIAPPSAGTATRPDKTPLDVHLRVRDGRIAFIDRFVVPNNERRQSIALDVDAILAPNDPSYYRVDATLDDGTRHYPIKGRARFDHARGFASQHWWTPEIPIGPIVDFALSTHAANVVDGRLRSFDARLYGFIRPDGTTDTHAGANARLEGGKIFSQQLALPIGDAHGPLYVNDQGLFTTGIDATLAAVPLHLVGAVYDLAHPTLRFALTAQGPLARLKTISLSAAKRPISGDVRLAMRIDGALTNPLVRADFSSSRFVYDRFTLHDVRGDVAFSGTAFDVVGVRAHYGPLTLLSGGRLELEKDVRANLVVAVDGPSDAIPYAQMLLPRTRANGVIVLTGTNEKLGSTGYIAARGAGGTLDAPFAITPEGIGTVGPLALDRADGARLYARLDVDRPHGSVAGVVAVHRLSLLPAHGRTLPGLTIPLSDLRGALDGDVALDVRGSNLADAAGAVHVRGAAVGSLALGDADVRLAGNGRSLGLDAIRVRGPLADLDAGGAYTSGMFAAQGRLRTSFARLRPLLRGAPARGTIDLPLRVVATSTEKVLQIDRGRFGDAAIGPIALRDASATIVQRGNAIDVRAARLGVAGGNVVAHGSFGNGGSMLLSASGIGLDGLGVPGLPVRGGRLTAIARLEGTQHDPRAALGVALAGARFANAPLAAAGFATYRDGRLRIDDTSATFAGATATATGSVDGLRPAKIAPRVDLTAQLAGADVGTLARIAHVRLPYPQAAVDATVHVAGAASDPAVNGSARIPVGSINGLTFRDVVVPVHGTLRALDVSGGRAVVGTTALHFDASAGATRTHVAIAAPRVDLADFNDYFDTAETLAGRGHLAGSLTLGGSSLATSGDVALRGTRIRRLPIGDVSAAWTSHGRTIFARGAAGGAHGRLDANGSAILPASDPLHRLAASDLDVGARLSGLDLGTWLPAFGMQVPVTGRIDGNAHVRGVAPRLALAGQAALTNGVVGRVPIRRLTVVASADRGRARITSAQLQALNLTATGSGTFGLDPSQPFDLALHAVSPDVGAFARQATGKPFDIAGALDATLHAHGTRNAPALAATVNVANPRVRNVVANRAHLDAAFGDRRLTLRDASIDFPTGILAFSGSVPATQQPPFIDRRNAPITAHVLVQHVDLGQFTALFPNGTKLGGLLDGDVRVNGTVRDPSLAGQLALTKGSYVSPLLASGVRNATATLALAGHRAGLSALHADIGGGAIDGDGDASVGDLSALQQTLAFRLTTREKNLGLEVANLFRSKVDGDLAVSRTIGNPILIAGNLAFSHTRIPIAALLPRPSSSSAPPPIPIAFDLNVSATKDDRVQGPNVDVGALGKARLTGTLAHPTLAGRFTATDGTLSFYRTFVLQSARVAFAPSNGIIPNVDATATTHIPDPSTDVLLHVHGPATQLSLDLASRPDYDRAQILGLLVNAQAFGAVRGVAQTSPTGGGNALQGAATGFVDQQFTRSIFQPFSSSIGSAIGLSSFEFAPSVTGGFTANAMRRLSEHVTATFGETQGPNGSRQSVALSGNFSNATAVQLSLYSAGTAPRSFGVATPFTPTGPTNLELDALAPPPGSSGFVFSYVKKFWVGGPPVPTPQQIRNETAPGKVTVQH